jgi:curved DNA-binding protein CbpA
LTQWQQSWKDYYKILNIARTAEAKTIKKAYRKLAKKYHPDINPNDSSAEENFKLVNEANECLSNASLKKEYDASYDEWIRLGEPKREGDIGNWQENVNNSYAAPNNGDAANAQANSSSQFDEQFYAEGEVYREDIRAFIDEYSKAFNDAMDEINQKLNDINYNDYESDFLELSNFADAFVKNLKEYLVYANHYGLAEEKTEINNLIKKTNRRTSKLQTKIRLLNTTRKIDVMTQELNGILFDMPSLLEGVYTGKENNESYSNKYNLISQKMKDYLAELNPLLDILDKEGFVNDYQKFVRQKAILQFQFRSIPNSLEHALKDVKVGSPGEMYGLTVFWGASHSYINEDAKTYYGMHFIKNSNFRRKHNFINCSFDSNCDIAAGSNLTNCTFGRSVNINSHLYPDDAPDEVDFGEVVNSRIINCKFSNEAFIGGCNKEGQGITVINTSFGRDCSLGGNSLFTDCTFGSNCKGGWGVDYPIFINGVKFKNPPTSAHSSRSSAQQTQSGSQPTFNTSTSYDYSPYNDPYNDFSYGWEDIDGWLRYTNFKSSIVAQAGQKFLSGDHTIQIVEDGILIDGDVPKVNGKPIDVSFYEHLDGKEYLCFKRECIDFADKTFYFNNENVTYRDKTNGLIIFLDPSPYISNSFTQTAQNSASKPQNSNAKYARRFI